jgi:ribosomal subunit interface protein
LAYQIVGIDIELTPQVKEEVADKIGKLDKYLTGFDDDTFFIRVALNKNQRNRRWTDALVDLVLPGDLRLLARGKASTPVHAVHLAVIDLERQLKEYKERSKPYMSKPVNVTPTPPISTKT